MRTINQSMGNVAIKPVRKSVFEMSDEELQERLRPTAERVKRETWDRNSYITYYDEKVCPGYNFMVHEYRDRKELVRVSENGETELIKIL